MEFQTKMEDYLKIVESGLDRFFPASCEPQKTVSEAARYSLLAGGKRIRPVLCLSVGALFGTPAQELLPYACAIEMIHTFSLIHDDLPAMDNDDYRRGRLTCHKIYGEGIAVLAGDALANKAYEIMLEDCSKCPKQEKIDAAAVICRATGDCGMIGGQTIDLESEHQKIPVDLLRKMHAMKTGALIKAPVLAACSLSKAPEDILAALSQYADALGLAFQIKDDILDVTSDSKTMGKTIGKDCLEEKSTYVTLFGLEKAQDILQETTRQAFSVLQTVKTRGYDTGFLEDLTDYLLQRKS